MVGRPPWALGFAALGVALVAAGCTGPSPQARRGGDGVAAPRFAQTTVVTPSPVRSEGGDPPSSIGTPLPSTDRDERTLAQEHPYRDRHGMADCEIDCSVHEAGYKWAALHSLRDQSLCASQDPYFVVGCRAYVQDHAG
jgi:hypothetical protein